MFLDPINLFGFFCTEMLHQATPWDMTQPRVMWHSRIAGNPASESALAS